jgi:hypothetical protein
MKPYRQPRRGDIWKENDPRFDRYVVILDVDWLTCGLFCKETNRKSRSRKDRFNGRNKGYSFVSSAPKKKGGKK